MYLAQIGMKLGLAGVLGGILAVRVSVQGRGAAEGRVPQRLPEVSADAPTLEINNMQIGKLIFEELFNKKRERSSGRRLSHQVVWSSPDEARAAGTQV